MGVPLKATYTVLPSGLAWMPRGRLPTGIVPSTRLSLPLMTVRSPDFSLDTKT